MLLGDIIGLNAGKSPDRLALIDGDRELTYGQLHEKATRLAMSGSLSRTHRILVTVKEATGTSPVRLA